MSRKPTTLSPGKIYQGDCLKLMKRIDDGSVDLVFADPPFNIGYKYDEYDDRQDDEKYLDWCREWIAEAHRVLSPTGTFWLAIGDEYAAELKVAAQREIGFTTRSWVIWYYTFGVNCKYKFSRSHVHLFQFVKDAKNFTFNADDPAIRVPSARALVYGDKRANPKGRLPDDTWILRPQDFQCDKYGFTPEQDTWFFSRVAGTFKERQGFHGCQMPEQLLGRIIRSCSNEGDLVLDPFAGSGTTLAVAKKLGRDFLGCELSEDYALSATKRLKALKSGDVLNGPADPIDSAPSTANGVVLDKRGRRISQKDKSVRRGQKDTQVKVRHTTRKNLRQDFSDTLREAFHSTHEGFSSDRLLADPHLNEAFITRCIELGIPGTSAEINRMFISLRKRGNLGSKFTPRTVPIAAVEFNQYSFAAEIAWKLARIEYGNVSLDEILCDPMKAKLFDSIASSSAPGFKPVEYRWAALRLRKRRTKDTLISALKNPGKFVIPRFKPANKIQNIDPNSVAQQSGLYLLKDVEKKDLYLGETSDFKVRLLTHQQEWHSQRIPHFVTFFPLVRNLRQSKTCTVAHRTPPLNVDQAVVKS